MKSRLQFAELIVAVFLVANQCLRADSAPLPRTTPSAQGISPVTICDFVDAANYLQWLQDNTKAAWMVRRAADSLSWFEWQRPTPGGKVLHFWDCIASLEAWQVVPPPVASLSLNTKSTTNPPPQ